MSSRRASFHSYDVIAPKNVILGDDTLLDVVDKGSIMVDIKVKGRVKTITIKDELHMPKMKANLLSVGHLVSKHLRVEFRDEGSFVSTPSREEVAIIHKVNGLY